MIVGIRKELHRVGAADIRVSMDDGFDPTLGSLLKVQHGSVCWQLIPETFLQLLRELTDDVGSDAVHGAVESHLQPVRHGPALESALEPWR